MWPVRGRPVAKVLPIAHGVCTVVIIVVIAAVQGIVILSVRVVRGVVGLAFLLRKVLFSARVLPAVRVAASVVTAAEMQSCHALWRRCPRGGASFARCV